MHVGQLKRIDGQFVFVYDNKYFNAKHVISLGPEFPLTQQEFTSDRLFPSLEDRIPSEQNPAYVEYCQVMGVDPKERDQIILLSSIGRRGPSSFIFYPLYDRTIRSQDLIAFREKMGLTTREFASVFEFSQSSLNALERNRIPGSEILKRLEIILNFPEVVSYLLHVNGAHLSNEKWSVANQFLQGLIEKK